MCGLFSFKKEHLDLINNKIDFYFNEISDYRLTEYKLEKDEEKIKLKTEFYDKCEIYLNEINKLCTEIEGELVINDIGINSDLVKDLGTDISQLLGGN